jgi:hypothetical protein
LLRESDNKADGFIADNDVLLARIAIMDHSFQTTIAGSLKILSDTMTTYTHSHKLRVDKMDNQLQVLSKALDVKHVMQSRNSHVADERLREVLQRVEELEKQNSTLGKLIDVEDRNQQQRYEDYIRLRREHEESQGECPLVPKFALKEVYEALEQWETDFGGVQDALGWIGQQYQSELETHLLDMACAQTKLSEIEALSVEHQTLLSTLNCKLGTYEPVIERLTLFQLPKQWDMLKQLETPLVQEERLVCSTLNMSSRPEKKGLCSM